MLNDLYLLSCYFDPAQAALYEDELLRRYGEEPVGQALREGLLERRPVPCGRARFLCWLSEKGRMTLRAQQPV